MNSLRRWLYRPKRSDSSLLAQFYFADEDLNSVAAELDSFEGRKDPERCTTLVNQLRSCQARVLTVVFQMMEETVKEERAPRDFRVKFPDDVIQENLAGQLWFGAECLAAGSSIMNREVESASMRPLARALTKNLDSLRSLLREHCLRSMHSYTQMVKESLIIFDKLFAEFELSYVSAMVPVKSAHEYDMIQEITVLFSETVHRALSNGLLSQDTIDEYDPALMFTIPRLAIVSGVFILKDGPLNPDNDPWNISEMFRPFQTLLLKIRELLSILTDEELHMLECALCSQAEPTFLNSVEKKKKEGQLQRGRHSSGTKDGKLGRKKQRSESHESSTSAESELTALEIAQRLEALALNFETSRQKSSEKNAVDGGSPRGVTSSHLEQGDAPEEVNSSHREEGGLPEGMPSSHQEQRDSSCPGLHTENSQGDLALCTELPEDNPPGSSEAGPAQSPAAHICDPPSPSACQHSSNLPPDCSMTQLKTDQPTESVNTGCDIPQGDDTHLSRSHASCSAGGPCMSIEEEEDNDTVMSKCDSADSGLLSDLLSTSDSLFTISSSDSHLQLNTPDQVTTPEQLTCPSSNPCHHPDLTTSPDLSCDPQQPESSHLQTNQNSSHQMTSSSDTFKMIQPDSTQQHIGSESHCSQHNAVREPPLSPRMGCLDVDNMSGNTDFSKGQSEVTETYKLAAHQSSLAIPKGNQSIGQPPLTEGGHDADGQLSHDFIESNQPEQQYSSYQTPQQGDISHQKDVCRSDISCEGGSSHLATKSLAVASGGESSEKSAVAENYAGQISKPCDTPVNSCFLKNECDVSAVNKDSNAKTSTVGPATHQSKLSPLENGEGENGSLDCQILNAGESVNSGDAIMNTQTKTSQGPMTTEKTLVSLSGGVSGTGVESNSHKESPGPALTSDVSSPRNENLEAHKHTQKVHTESQTTSVSPEKENVCQGAATAATLKQETEEDGASISSTLSCEQKNEARAPGPSKGEKGECELSGKDVTHSHISSSASSLSRTESPASDNPPRSSQRVLCPEESTEAFDGCNSSETSSYTSDNEDKEEIALALRAAEKATRKTVRDQFSSSNDMIHRLFVCISGVADQLQTNYAGDLRNILRSVFDMNCSERTEMGDVEKTEDATPLGAAYRALRATRRSRNGAQKRDPPAWLPDAQSSDCMSCQVPFTFVRRRHHCRNCGKIYCSRCSSNFVPLPHLGQERAVRVCNRCFMFRVTPFTVRPT